MIKITRVRDYYRAIRSINRKHATLEMLSKKIGIVGDVINNDLAYFDPLIKFDLNYNYKDLLDQLEEHIKIMKKLQKPRNIRPVQKRS